MSDNSANSSGPKRVISQDVIITLGAHENTAPIKHWLARESAQNMAFHESQIQYWKNLLQSIEDAQPSSAQLSSTSLSSPNSYTTTNSFSQPTRSASASIYGERPASASISDAGGVPMLKLSSIAKKKPRGAVMGAAPNLATQKEE